MDFEKSIKEIEEISEKMEQGGQNLDQNIKSFRRGIELIRQCQEYLNDTEMMIEQIDKD